MFKRKGQSTLEYAIVVAIIVGGLLAMQFYVKRGWEGRLRGAADDMGEQFDPRYYTANLNLRSSSRVTQDLQAGRTQVQHQADAISSRTGQENVAAYDVSTDVYEGRN